MVPDAIHNQRCGLFGCIYLVVVVVVVVVGLLVGVLCGSSVASNGE